MEKDTMLREAMEEAFPEDDAGVGTLERAFKKPKEPPRWRTPCARTSVCAVLMSHLFPERGSRKSLRRLCWEVQR